MILQWVFDNIKHDNVHGKISPFSFFFLIKVWYFLFIITALDHCLKKFVLYYNLQWAHLV